MTIACDFDGTVVKHAFPSIGEDIGAVPVLKKLVAKGHKLILYTMRSNTAKGNHLDDAINWFLNNDIDLYAVGINPQQKHWTDSTKCYAELYLDDAGLGFPLVFPENERPYADWKMIELQLIARGVL